MVRRLFDELRRPVYRRRVKRVVVTREQEHRHFDITQGFKRAPEQAPVEMIGFEYVATDDNEIAGLFGCKSPDLSHGVEPCRAEAGLRLLSQEVPCQA